MELFFISSGTTFSVEQLSSPEDLHDNLLPATA
jgi:hypothetical protein